MNLTLRDLEAFRGVARLGSFTRAARSLNMSQPALSVRIHHLEDALGVRQVRFLRHNLTGDALALGRATGRTRSV